MGLEARINKIMDDRNGIQCGIHRFHATLAKKEAEEFIGYINNHAIPMSVLAEACKAEGYPVTINTIRHHRQGKCSCKKGK